MWISRDKDNRLWMHLYSKPIIHKYIDCDGNLIERWATESQIEIDSSLFDELTFENSPKEVILQIKDGNVYEKCTDTPKNLDCIACSFHRCEYEKQEEREPSCTPIELVQYYNDDNKKIVLTLYYADYKNARIKFINQCKQSHLFSQMTPSELTNKFYEKKWLEHQKIEIAVKDIIEIKQYTDYTQIITKNNYSDNKGTLLLVCETKEEIEKLCG